MTTDRIPETPDRGQRERILDPVDRMSEILFGLIMVLTFTCTLSVSADDAEVRELIIAAIGCNAAWGLVDGVMFVTMGLVERAHASRIAGVPAEPRLTKEDWVGGAAVTLLVFGSTFPVVVPFIFIDDAMTALRVSNGIALVMLYGCGHVLGQHAGIRPVRTGVIMAALGVVLVTTTIALGG